jgi:phosphoglycerate dehydrogenase-like enzyme
MMKKGAVLINTARGPLIHEDALVAALGSGHLAGVGLDVFEVEPLPHSSALLRLDTALIAPHNSNSSPRAWEHVHESTVSQLLAALQEVEV